jgi:serine/threonine protein kinase
MWQAPEVIANPSKCSKAGDVYSFGIIMWELLMMQKPWSGTPHALIQHLVQTGSRPSLPSTLSDLPGSRPHEFLPAVEDYIRLMERCWDERVEVRPHFEQVVEELEGIEKKAAAHRCGPSSGCWRSL